MELQDAIGQMREIHAGRPFPYEAVEAAVQQKDAVTPILLQSLNEIYEAVRAGNEYEDVEDDLHDPHDHAVFLLAQFREKMRFQNSCAF